MTATGIDISQLPRLTQGQVLVMRDRCHRPVYYLPLTSGGRKLKVLPEKPVGSDAYGEEESALFEAGWKMVIGDVDK